MPRARALLPGVAVLALGCATSEAVTPPPEPEPVETIGQSRAWAPPAWFPEQWRSELTSIEGLSISGPTDGLTGVRAPSVLVYDVDRDEVLFERKADLRRPIASVTKLFASLALASEDPDLTREVCITYEHWPVKPGARSHLSTGECYRGWDLLGAALVKSDNRGAMTLATVADLGFRGFVERMDDVAADIGATHSSFEDPAGLGDGNLSTARDVVRAVIAVSLHPMLAPVASAPSWQIETTDGGHVRELTTTDFLRGRQDLDVLAAKTGYTDPARYCFATVVQLDDGHRIAVALLGDERPSWRVADMNRILHWVRERDAVDPHPLLGGE